MRAVTHSMTVSAVIPAFNRRQYIGRALDSVLVQSVPVNEVLVVDDGSTDGTNDYVAAHYGDCVRVVRQSHTGVSAARRRGVLEAQGEWIAFLDSDDEWTPMRNQRMTEAAVRLPQDVAWLFGNLEIVTDGGSVSTTFEEHGLALHESPELFQDALATQFPFQFSMLDGSLIRRRALLERNCFSEGLQHSEDVLAGMQVACHYRFAAIPAVVGRYFRTSDLASSSLQVIGVNGLDYHRSRMLAFASVIESGRRGPWSLLYAAHVRNYCMLLAQRGSVPSALALQQFRYGGLSLKGIAFLCAATLGRAGIRLWRWAAERRRQYLHTSNIRTSQRNLSRAGVRPNVENN